MTSRNSRWDWSHDTFAHRLSAQAVRCLDHIELVRVSQDVMHMRANEFPVPGPLQTSGTDFHTLWTVGRWHSGPRWPSLSDFRGSLQVERESWYVATVDMRTPRLPADINCREPHTKFSSSWYCHEAGLPNPSTETPIPPRIPFLSLHISHFLKPFPR